MMETPEDKLKHALDEAIEAAQSADVVTEEQHFAVLSRIEQLAKWAGVVVI